MNTIGKNDGILNVWINGINVVETNKFIFRNSDIVKTSGILFATFFGGEKSIHQAAKTKWIKTSTFLGFYSYT